MFFFFSKSECFLEMGLDMNRLCLQLGGGSGATTPAPPPGGLIQNKCIKKKGTKECKTKQGKNDNFCFS